MSLPVIHPKSNPGNIFGRRSRPYGIQSELSRGLATSVLSLKSVYICEWGWRGEIEERGGTTQQTGRFHSGKSVLLGIVGTLVALLAGLGVPAAAQSNQFCLIQASEMSRRSNGRLKAKRFIGNGELAQLTTARLGWLQFEAETEEPEAQPIEDNQIDDVEDLETWRRRFEEAHLDLKMALDREMLTELRINHLRNQYFSAHDGSFLELLQEQLEEARVSLIGHSAEIEERKRTLTQLEGAAQRAGLATATIRKLTRSAPLRVRLFSVTEPVP